MLYITVINDPAEREKKHQGYKYIITRDSYAYDAYRTDRGFKEFIQRYNIKLRYTGTHAELNGDTKMYMADTDIGEVLFRSQDVIDKLENPVAFTGLSNGSYVICYAVVKDKVVLIYRPNPSDKDVYKPLSLKDHIEFDSIHG